MTYFLSTVAIFGSYLNFFLSSLSGNSFLSHFHTVNKYLSIAFRVPENSSGKMDHCSRGTL